MADIWGRPMRSLSYPLSCCTYIVDSVVQGGDWVVAAPLGWLHPCIYLYIDQLSEYYLYSI